MNVLTIILILLAVFGFAVFFKLLKSVFKAAIYVFVLLAIALFVMGVVVYTDAAEFRNTMPNATLTFILVDETELVAGMQVLDFAESDVLLFSQSTMESFQTSYNQAKYDQILQDSYKVFFIDRALLEKMEVNLSYEEYDLTKTEALAILESDAPLDAATNIFAAQHGITQEEQKGLLREELVEAFETDQKMKDAVFSLFIAELLPTQTLYILRGLKEDEVDVHPETPLFRFLTYVPESWVAKGLEGGEENQSQVLEEEG